MTNHMEMMELESEANAAYDSVWEAYGATYQDTVNFNMEEDYVREQESLVEESRIKAIESKFGLFHGPVYDLPLVGKGTCEWSEDRWF